MNGFGERPFGLRELIVSNEDASTFTRLPAAMTMRIVERIESREFATGGVAGHVEAVVDAVEWEVESGGISLRALGIMTGRTWTETGWSPSRRLTLTTKHDNLPYIRFYGKAMGDAGGDIHAKLFKCKITDLEGGFRGGEFYMTRCRGIAVADQLGNIAEFVQNEQPAVLDAGLGQDSTNELPTLGANT